MSVSTAISRKGPEGDPQRGPPPCPITLLVNFEVSPPDQVLWIWRTLEEAGFETWIVGGAIRDILLGRPADDWDFATRAHPEQIMAAFPRTVPIGVDHGTVGVLTPDGTLYEVTTFRRDVETFGRRAVVEFADSIEEDLSPAGLHC